MLQEAFGQQEVIDQGKVSKEDSTQNVISALLGLCLASSNLHAVEIRLAACECLKAYFYEHTQIRQFFLQHAIDGHVSESHEDDNLLTILLTENETESMRLWLASVLLLHLLHEDVETKTMAMAVSQGNADDGEEVVTCIQTIAANLIACEAKDAEERVFIAFLVILCSWLYENPDAVNDFLSEGSNLQSIIQIALRTEGSRILVSGLCCFLFGIVYEFSTKDSPVSRETVSNVLTNSLGREQYLDRMTKLREHPIVRDFEVQDSGNQALFDQTFVDFLKDNFSRLLRAIDRPPGLEIPVLANGVQRGISRELVDSLKAQVEATTAANQKFEAELLTLERKLGQEQADHRKAKESASLELGRIRHINKALQEGHEADSKKRDQDDLLRSREVQTRVSLLEAELSRLKADHTAEIKQRTTEHAAELTRKQKKHVLEISQKHDEQVHQHTAEISQIRDTHAQECAALKAEHSEAISRATDEHEQQSKDHQAEIETLKSAVSRLQSELDKASKEHVQDLQTAHEDYTAKAASLEGLLHEAESKAKAERQKTTKATSEAAEVEERRKTVQTELDDMLMVLGDIEEKRSRDKVCGSVVCAKTDFRLGSKNSVKPFPMTKRMTTRDRLAACQRPFRRAAACR